MSYVYSVYYSQIYTTDDYSSIITVENAVKAQHQVYPCGFDTTDSVKHYTSYVYSACYSQAFKAGDFSGIIAVKHTVNT